MSFAYSTVHKTLELPRGGTYYNGNTTTNGHESSDDSSDSDDQVQDTNRIYNLANKMKTTDIHNQYGHSARYGVLPVGLDKSAGDSDEEKGKKKSNRKREKKKRRREKKRQERQGDDVIEYKQNHMETINSTKENSVVGRVSGIEGDDFDADAAFFKKVKNKKKGGSTQEQLSSKAKTDSKSISNDEVVEDLDPTVLRSRQLAIRGNEMANEGMYPAAIELFTEAIRLEPKDHRFYGNRSYCYDRLNQFDKALRDSEKAINLSPEWPKGYFRQGRALAGLRDNAAAEKAFMQVLKLDRNCDDAMQELRRVRTDQLTEMGFCRQRAEHAIRSHDTVQQALDSLLADVAADSSLSGEVYVSDDEDYTPESLLNTNVNTPDISANRPVHPQIRTATAHSCDNKKMDPDNPDGLTALWVGNVLPEVTQNKLQALFQKYGVVTSIRMLPEKYCAFVNFKTKEAAGKAMKCLQAYEVANQKLLIKFPDNPISSGTVVIKKAPGTAIPGTANILTQKSNNEKVLPDGIDPKASRPVNGDECYFWRTTGCTFGKQCRWKHKPENKGIDRKPWHQVNK